MLGSLKRIFYEQSIVEYMYTSVPSSFPIECSPDTILIKSIHSLTQCAAVSTCLLDMNEPVQRLILPIRFMHLINPSQGNWFGLASTPLMTCLYGTITISHSALKMQIIESLDL